MLNDSILSYTRSAKTYIANTLVCCSMIFPFKLAQTYWKKLSLLAHPLNGTSQCPGRNA